MVTPGDFNRKEITEVMKIIKGNEIILTEQIIKFLSGKNIKTIKL